MCIQWTLVLYSVVITQQSTQFNSPCNEFMSVWSMFVYNNIYIEAVSFYNYVTIRTS